jgi:dihydrodipicolinate synthase/N-acetylneuraminate lyase
MLFWAVDGPVSDVSSDRAGVGAETGVPNCAVVVEVAITTAATGVEAAALVTPKLKAPPTRKIATAAYEKIRVITTTPLRLGGLKRKYITIQKSA